MADAIDGTPLAGVTSARLIDDAFQMIHRSAQQLPAKLKACAALTLTHLCAGELRSFHKAGVRSAADLLDVPLAELARRMGVDAASVARDRLKADGVPL